MTEYIEVLLEEIKQTMDATKHPSSLQTIFLGGGTPSLLDGAELQRILTTVKQGWHFDEDIEISLEANPGTLSPSSLSLYRQSGVNRISLGAQAFQDELLHRCGRGHSVAEIYEAVEMIKEAGFTNFNLDLISGLPGQTMTDWYSSLTKTIELNPTHISIYDLTIEVGTAFSKRYQPGQHPLPSEELTVEMYKTAHHILTESGYRHYEISNYAKPGYECRHNLNYWYNRSFYGFGMGAASYLNFIRWERPRKIRSYIEMVKQQKYPVIPEESINDRLFDTLMQGLRLEEGIELSRLNKEFGVETTTQVCQYLSAFQEKGWIEITDRIRLCPLEGWLFSDVINSYLYEILS